MKENFNFIGFFLSTVLLGGSFNNRYESGSKHAWRIRTLQYADGEIRVSAGSGFKFAVRGANKHFSK